MLKATVFTLFPALFPGPLAVSVLGRALEQKRWDLKVVDLRHYALDKHQTVDDTCFGGGAGMVMRPDVIDQALTSVYGSSRPRKLLYMSPRGPSFTQKKAKDLAIAGEIGLLCGRFEGVDQRVLDKWSFQEISLGDYILSGGEVAAMALLDATVRHIPGVLGNQASLFEESFTEGLLEYPQYTRPQVWQNMAVPDVLLSGHHEKIRQWRHGASCRLTQERRPDLWHLYTHMQRKEKS